MGKKLLSFLKSFNATKLLAVLFCVFVLHVGYGAQDGLVRNLRNAKYHRYSVSQFIDALNEQYSQMLPFTGDYCSLQNMGTYINFCGTMANILEQPELNDVVKLNNGFLVRLGSASVEGLDASFQSLKSLYEHQKENGKDFLFVLAPSKAYLGDHLLPSGYHSTTSQDMAYLTGLLDNADIPYLDLKHLIQEENRSFDETFFATDHHWNSETGFWAYTKIIDHLTQTGVLSDTPADYIDPDNYHFEVLKDAFLGSYGKRTGIPFGNLDDFCMIQPKFETNISVHIEDAGISLQGPFEEVVYAAEQLTNINNQNYYDSFLYGTWGHADQPLTQWKNENAPFDKKVMLIGDSYGNIPFSFMPLYFTDCNELDMRSFDQDFVRFYQEYQPDLIILLANASSIPGDNVSYPYFENDN